MTAMSKNEPKFKVKKKKEKSQQTKSSWYFAEEIEDESLEQVGPLHRAVSE